MLALRSYLGGCQFILITDHHALQWILNLAAATEKLACLQLSFLEYDFEIVHRADDKHKVADALSRLPSAGVEKTEVEEEIPVMVVIRMKS